MMQRRSMGVHSVVAIAAVGALGFGLPGLAASGDVPVATPPGITLQMLGAGQGYNLEARDQEEPREQIAFADAKGMTLYTYDKDAPGKSRCTDACAKFWIPALAPRSARPVGDWSVFNRGHGVRQWEYRNRPVYTFVRDTDIGSLFGASPRSRGFGGFPGRGTPGAEAKGPPAGWHAALFFPSEPIAMPNGVAIQEVEDAGGLALVDAGGRTLYAFEGRGSARAVANQVVAAGSADREWKPLIAPALAQTMGQWSVITRSDGIRQWAFRGKPLATFAGDLSPGDANGVGWSKNWNAAVVARVYRPANVRFVQTLGRGKVLANEAGLTLYRRDGMALASGGGRSLRHGLPYRPAIGRAIGVGGCVAPGPTADQSTERDCLKEWHPFVAPADAQPDGFWDIAVRPDGTRQWVYQGYALYTYAGDQKPGDMNGDYLFSMALTLSETPNQPHSVGTPMHGTAALDWAIAYP